MSQVVVGLAGHIDHGKTALVKAVTGVNTDRLEEEIRRGMTIDIGFAFLTDEITLIDVPGHEKFVKNMMAGVSSVDAALLVIAADDGVMPQTREHLDILRLLDVRVGCIALNKVDLVEPDWLELVESDIRDLVEGTFLQDAPIVHTSAVADLGIEDLKSAILDMCGKVPAKTDRGIFRMSIDRVFTIKGFGTVVTGTVSSGSLKTGETVELLPQEKRLKVRGLQTHTHSVDRVTLGDRAAVNLSGIERLTLKRGDQIGAPGYFQPANQVGATIELLPEVTKPLVQNQRIRVHLGTQEVLARIAITDGKTIQPGTSAPILLRLESPIVAAFDDRFIIRSYSPIQTIGGGKILISSVTEKWKIIREKISKIHQLSGPDRWVYQVESHGARPLNEPDVRRIFGYSPHKINERVQADPRLQWLTYKTDKWLVTRDQTSGVQNRIIDFLETFHQKQNYRVGALKEEIRQALKADPRFLDLMLDEMVSQGRLTREGEFYSIPGTSLTLTEEEQNLIRKMIHQLNAEKFNSSGIADLASKLGKPEKQVKLLLDIAEQQGKIIRLAGRLMFTRENFDRLKKEVLDYFKTNEVLNVADFKDMAETSRKYAMPLLEYFDKLKITYRVPEGRKRAR